jgi:hypothetical protein
MRKGGVEKQLIASVLAFSSANVLRAGPDVIVSQLGNTVANYGQDVGIPISAFAVETVSCNIGNAALDWYESPDSNQHPVIHQGMFKLLDHRFQQVGMSWLKHGFYALNQNACGHNCTNVGGPGDRLFVGCSDPYVASLNGARVYLGPRWEVNPHTGSFPANHTLPPDVNSQAKIPHRLQVHNYDLDLSANAGALYFVEGQYVHPDDAASENGNNNASYRRVMVTYTAPPTNRYNIVLQETTQVESPAIRAWKDTDPEVVETDAQVPDEGLFILAAKAIDQGDGFWRYEYAVQNLNSDRSGGLFAVPLPEGAIVDVDENPPGFHDVDYHDGDGVGFRRPACAGGPQEGAACTVDADCPESTCECPGCKCSAGVNVGDACSVPADCPGAFCRMRLNFDGTDWPATVELGVIRWATTPYEQDSNANALRWGTLYNFWFEANVPPDNTTVVLGLFKPGFPSEIGIPTIGPRLTIIDCNENGVSDSCDVSCGPGCAPPCGVSLDCAPNGVPDECEVDCNANNTPDFCDIRDGESEDCQPNTVPDDCEPDCDGDGTIDACELILDTDADGILDCDDLCLLTTPAGRCLPPLDQMVQCCFSSHIMYDFWTWRECESFCLDDPDPENCGPVCDDPPVCPGTPCRESPCRDGCLIGDFDGDGDIDLADAAYLGTCFSGPTGIPAFVAPSAECQVHFDTEPDGDVDLTDYVNFFADYSGP